LAPLVGLVTVTFTAAWQKILSPSPALGFLAQATQLEAALRAGSAMDPAVTRELIFNARLDAVVCGLFLALVAAVLADSIRVWIGILRGVREARLCEAPFTPSRLRVEEL
jgi:carbon starvation protein